MSEDDEKLLLRWRIVQLILLVVFVVPSTISSVYIVYVSIRKSTFRRRFQNQTLIFLVFLILLMNFLDVSIDISFYARGFIWPQNRQFCLFWQIIDYFFLAAPIWCEAIFTVQRYVLVFLPQFLRSKRQKFVAHYFPLFGSTIYLFVFYVTTHLTLTCSDHWHFNKHLCGEVCIDQNRKFSLFNWFFNILLPIFIIIFGSLFLLGRVLWKRREMQRNLRNWSKNRKMLVQLLSITAVYAFVWIPLSIFSIIESFESNSTISVLTKKFFYFAVYLSAMLVPIVVVFLFPELKFSIFRRFQTNSVSSVAS